jgi:hypothetical protein
LSVGYLHAKASGKIKVNINPVVFFYDTFFEILSIKTPNAPMSGIGQFKSKSMRKKASYISAVFSFITNVNRISINEWSKVTETHRNAGWSRSQCLLIGSVFVETLMLILDQPDINEETIMCWRIAISYIIDKLTEQHASLEKRIHCSPRSSFSKISNTDIQIFQNVET